MKLTVDLALIRRGAAAVVPRGRQHPALRLEDRAREADRVQLSRLTRSSVLVSTLRSMPSAAR